jgi:hypothetical protein
MNRQEIEDKINEAIVGEDYHVFEDTTQTVCCLKLKNGFSVVGESACISKALFDTEIGQREAKNNALQKLWALEGWYNLRRL